MERIHSSVLSLECSLTSVQFLSKVSTLALPYTDDILHMILDC